MDLTCLEYFYLGQNIFDVWVYRMAILQNTYKSRPNIAPKKRIDLLQHHKRFIVTILQNDLLSILTYDPDMVLLSNLVYMQKLKVGLVSYIIKVIVWLWLSFQKPERHHRMIRQNL